jgi:hypothetical protein
MGWERTGDTRNDVTGSLNHDGGCVLAQDMGFTQRARTLTSEDDGSFLACQSLMRPAGSFSRSCRRHGIGHAAGCPVHA